MSNHTIDERASDVQKSGEREGDERADGGAGGRGSEERKIKTGMGRMAVWTLGGCFRYELEFVPGKLELISALAKAALIGKA